MRGSLIGLMRHAGWFLRSIAGVVLVAFTSLTVTPAVLAAEQVVAQQEMQAQATANAKGNMGQILVKVRDELRVLADRPDVLDRKPTHEQRKAAKDALKALRQELRGLDQEVRAEFAANQKLITDKKLAAVIQERQDTAVAQYKAEYAALEQGLVAIEGKADEVGARTLAVTAFERLSKQKLERSHQDFDPNDLPNKSLKPDRTRLPKTDPIAWVEEGFVSNPQILLASTAPFDYSKLAGAGNPAYLAATTEVVLTDAIRAKADELGKDPVAIYNWVRNNVVWQPTWGAIQDAELTLSAQRGNAFDIASLTIALFRASGIPARYVHGTIDVPEDKFRSWMGGWQNLNPAIDFASAGGIPIQPITSGGRITKVRMEHIWVEAAIDYAPSRGSRNLVADTWLALDPSFKQMEVLQGLDSVAISGIDPEQLASDFLATGIVNEQEGWVSGFDPAVLQSAQTQAKNALESYIEQNLPNATVGDVLGGRRIITLDAKTFPASLPNKLVAVGARYGSSPTSLQQQITFAFGKDALGEPRNPKTYPWAQLNNRLVTLSFKPATQADEDTLRALLPAGAITDVNQLPTSIPAYLIKVVPELKVEGTTVMTDSALNLGNEVEFVFNPRFAGRFELPRSYRVIAGSFLAIAVVGGSVDRRSFESAQSRLASTSSVIASGDSARIESLSRDSVFGDMFHSGLLAYYGQLDKLAEVRGHELVGSFIIAGGTGSFGYEPVQESVFGVVRGLSNGNAVMNIPIAQVTGVDQQNQSSLPQFRLQVGMISSILEHSVPERLFKTSSNNVEGISTAKAFELAASMGQRIYEVTAENQARTLANLRLSPLAIAEIVQAVSLGKYVIAHTDNIQVAGYQGAGFMIADPETGDAAFRISGGKNGGIIAIGGVGIFAIGAVAGIGVIGGVAIAPMLAAMALAAGLIIFSLEMAFNPDAKWADIEDNVLAVLAPVLAPLAALGVGAAIASAILGQLMSLLSIAR